MIIVVADAFDELKWMNDAVCIKGDVVDIKNLMMMISIKSTLSMIALKIFTHS